jgi:pyruvate ferredoxin oxidoreductase gamma subunit
MSKYFEIRWHGRGGQGTVTGAKTLAKVVQSTGKYVVAFPEYGPERRGAPLRAYNRFSDQEIRIHTPVESPDVVIVVDATLLRMQFIKDGIHKESIFIVNTELPAADIKKMLRLSDTNKVYTVPADAISKALFGREIPNSAVIGAFTRAKSDIASKEVVLKEAGGIFESMLGSDLVEKNVQAVKEGAEKGDSV